MTNYPYSNLKDTAKQEDRNPLNPDALRLCDIHDKLKIRRFTHDVATGGWVSREATINGHPYTWGDRYEKDETCEDNILLIDVDVVRYSGDPATTEVWSLSDMGVTRYETGGGWNPGSYTLRRPITA